jgi:hypothetical protein
MTAPEIFKLIGAFILSVGSAGLILAALSTWLGKVWASRILESERAKHSKELEKLRAELHKDTHSQLRHIQQDLDIYKQKHLQGFSDKVQNYRLIADMVADILGDFDLMEATGYKPTESNDNFEKFNRGLTGSDQHKLFKNINMACVIDY